jgi:hypothetical protein
MFDIIDDNSEKLEITDTFIESVCGKSTWKSNNTNLIKSLILLKVH